jgi:hypothetical protein
MVIPYRVSLPMRTCRLFRRALVALALPLPECQTYPSKLLFKLHSNRFPKLSLPYAHPKALMSMPRRHLR